MRPSFLAEPVFIIVSGLPASGKTTLASQISRHLGIALLDKDTILEALFDCHGNVGKSARRRLSRSSDLVFERLASEASTAVLVSHWRHPGLAQSSSGTPTDWLANLPGRRVEIHVACPTDVAVRRFIARRRHPGHLDVLRDEDELRRQFEELGALGPLGIGALVSVSGEGSHHIGKIVRAVALAGCPLCCHPDSMPLRG